MDVRNCRVCGRIFNYVAGPSLCPKCRDAQEKRFQDVKQYIYDNPGVGMVDVSEAMDVSVSQIRQWVREERLEFVTSDIAGIVCESCGTPIRSGRFCAKCKGEMIHNLGNAYKSPEPKKEPDEKTKAKPKMRYLK